GLGTGPARAHRSRAYPAARRIDAPQSTARIGCRSLISVVASAPVRLIARSAITLRVQSALQAAGYKIRAVRRLGDIATNVVNPETGMLENVNDPRYPAGRQCGIERGSSAAWVNLRYGSCAYVLRSSSPKLLVFLDQSNRCRTYRIAELLHQIKPD